MASKTDRFITGLEAFLPTSGGAEARAEVRETVAQVRDQGHDKVALAGDLLGPPQTNTDLAIEGGAIVVAGPLARGASKLFRPASKGVVKLSDEAATGLGRLFGRGADDAARAGGRTVQRGVLRRNAGKIAAGGAAGGLLLTDTGQDILQTGAEKAGEGVGAGLFGASSGLLSGFGSGLEESFTERPGGTIGTIVIVIILAIVAAVTLGLFTIGGD